MKAKSLWSRRYIIKIFIIFYNLYSFFAQNCFRNSKDKDEVIRIFMDNRMKSILNDKNFEHFFIDGTFECVPAGYEFSCFRIDFILNIF